MKRAWVSKEEMMKLFPGLPKSLRSSMKWISVKDRLPSKYQRVLCFSTYIDFKIFEDGIFYDGDTNCYCPVGEVQGVTHWMPLPEGPDGNR